MIRIKAGKDIVSGLTRTASKLGLPEPKNWHLPKHNYTGQIWALY
jgi:hypothetical protein